MAAEQIRATLQRVRDDPHDHPKVNGDAAAFFGCFSAYGRNTLGMVPAAALEGVACDRHMQSWVAEYLGLRGLYEYMIYSALRCGKPLLETLRYNAPYFDTNPDLGII